MICSERITDVQIFAQAMITIRERIDEGYENDE